MARVTAADKAYWKRVAKANAILEEERRAEAAKQLPGNKILRALTWTTALPPLHPIDPKTVAIYEQLQEEKSAKKTNLYEAWRTRSRRKSR